MTQPRDNALRVYFHSSWVSQTKKGGWAFLMTRKDSEGNLQRSRLKGSAKETTQQAMELTAIIEAFRRINERLRIGKARIKSQLRMLSCGRSSISGMKSLSLHGNS